MVTYKSIEREYFVLTEEAKNIVLNGSHEAKIFNLISSSVDGLTLQELEVGDRVFSFIIFNIFKSIMGPSMEHGLKQVFKNKWVKRVGNSLVKNVHSITDTVSHNLKVIQENGTHPDSSVITELRKRKLLEKKSIL